MGIPPTPAPASLVYQQELVSEVAAQKSKLIYFGKRRDWIETISDLADTHILDQFQCENGDTQPLCPTEKSLFTHVLETIDLAPDSTIILDATRLDGAPESPAFSAFWQSTLRLMKALGQSKTRSFRFIVLSTSPTLVWASPAAPEVLGAMVQGMLRAFRTEVGLRNAYGIEFPADASSGIIAGALRAELQRVFNENLVSYRYSRPSGADVRLSRFVPELHPLVEENKDVQLSGVAVIVGMGERLRWGWEESGGNFG
ncbi:hypothetical protein B0H14DRAFT_2575892 [Mycena olivaceomarginata]|nr:hypothetical protein B0H14DRAFT_2575892 [Mycena olivaceomarginata]